MVLIQFEYLANNICFRPVHDQLSPVWVRVRVVAQWGNATHPKALLLGCRNLVANPFGRYFTLELCEGQQHVQGYGCDCLSFETEDDRKAFCVDPQKVSLVTRFIETNSGAVRFTKNEWNAAEKLGERYFVHRVSFLPGRRDKAVLTIVNNHRAQSSAIRVEHEFLIDKVSSHEEFDLFQSEQGNCETQIKASQSNP